MPERLASILGSLLLDGRLPIDARLPSQRNLAAQLRVGRATVADAYSRLREEGLLVSRPGAGNWTAMPARVNRGAAPLAPGVHPVPGTLDLAIAVPPPARDAVTAAFRAAVTGLYPELADDRGLHAHGYHPAGIPQLREAIAARYTRRGVPTTPDQILVTVGAQGAIHILIGHLLSRGDLAVVERPGYPNAIDALRRAQARLVSVAVTDHGWDVEQMLGILAQANPALAYLVVDFHNPTGAVLPAHHREALVATAARRSTILVVDETHVELNLDGIPMPPPLAAFDRKSTVISVGSLSKVFWGGLRVGWVRASGELVRRLALHRSSIDLAGPVVEQLAATHLLANLDTLLPARLDDLAHRRDVLLAALTKWLPQWTWSGPPGGLSVWVRLDHPISTALADVAERYAVRLAPGPRFGLDGLLERFLRLPFALPPADLERAVERLADVEREVLADAGAGARRPPGRRAPASAQDSPEQLSGGRAG